MKNSWKTGLSFGLTSGVITTLGLIVGLHSGTHSQIAVMGGILTIAIADAFSDALGIHISQEATHKVSKKEIWESTASTFLFKFIFALTFTVPVLFLELSTAIWVSIAWGFSLISTISFYNAREQKESPLHAIAEHIGIAIVVIIATHFVGDLINTYFS